MSEVKFCPYCGTHFKPPQIVVVNVPADIFNMPIHKLEVRARSHHAFQNENIKTVGELVELSEAELLRLPNFGKISLQEIKDALSQFGLSLRKYGSS